MRIFQSVLGHSSEVSIANHCSRPTVLQQNCVCETGIKLICESPTTDDKNFNRHWRSFHSTRFKWPPGWPQPLVFRGKFFNSCNIQSFSVHRAALRTKIGLTLPAFSLRFVDFAIQFCFRCKFSFHDEWPLPRIVIDGIASFCLDNRLRQVPLFRVRQSGHSPVQALCWRILK